MMRRCIAGLVATVALAGCTHFANVDELRAVDASPEASADGASETTVTDGAAESTIVVEDASLPKCTESDEDGDGVGLEGTGCARDCNDVNADVFPGQTKFFAFADDAVEFDYDCNRIQEKRFPAHARCEEGPSGCEFTEGWLDAVPGCGVTGRWLKACTKLASGACGAAAANIESRVQECR